MAGGTARTVFVQDQFNLAGGSVDLLYTTRRAQVQVRSGVVGETRELDEQEWVRMAKQYAQVDRSARLPRSRLAGLEI